jgi:hypothetical protein
MEKKGQVTIFVIIAIIIVVAGILLYSFYPGIISNFRDEIKNPNAFMQTCLEDSLKENIEIVSLQGGVLRPEHYLLYEGSKVEYLCYTNENYKTCTIQVPFIESRIETELKKSLESEVDSCFESMTESFENKGYVVNLQKKDFSVDLEPTKVIIKLNSTVTLNKDSIEKYNSMKVLVNNNLYELASISQSILDWETKVGDAETTIYMDYYHHLKVEKYKQGDGSTIYIVSNRNTGEKFQFASRSVVWPPGYGII